MKEYQDLKDSIRTVSDYPVQGVQFRDITTLLQKPHLFKKMINAMKFDCLCMIRLQEILKI